MRLKLPLLLLSIAALVGCAYPKTIRQYDDECQIIAKKMVLDVKEFDRDTNCFKNDCVAQLVTEAAVLAASTVVSGSIVVAGNVVYWLQKRRDCKPRQGVPDAAAPTT